jgi:hypothetical protein
MEKYLEIVKRFWWIALAAIAILCLMAQFVLAATPVTVSWSNPTTYADGETIDAGKIATMTTKLYYTSDQQSWTYWGSVTSGGTSFNGTWPLAKGVPGWVAATSTIPAEGNESVKCNPAGFTDQWSAPSPPVNLKIVKQ